MTHNKAISKIERLLSKIRNSKFDESHIDSLFVTLRELPNATPSIREIGAFVAHGDIRDQGLINDIILRNYYFLNIQLGTDKEIINVDKNQYPNYFPELLRLQLKMFSDDDFRLALNLKGGQIQKSRAKLNKKNTFLIDGKYSRLTDKIGTNEIKLINHAMQLFRVGDGIDYDKLIDEVITLIEKDIEEDLLSCLRENKKEIFCCLLLLVNQVTFSIQKDVSTKTITHIDDNDLVSVCGLYPLAHESGSKIDVISPVFSSNYKTHEIFDDGVTREDIDSNNIEFSDESKKIIKRDNG